jgi:replicative DNA helicase
MEGKLVACSADPPNLTIDRTGDVSIAQLASRARRIKRQKNTQLIVVDYLQLVTGLKKEGREQEVAGIVAKLKALAKELEVPVVALCQLSRKVESHPDYRPQLGDLRESGAIEHHADLVVFIYRRGYYLEREGENSPLVKQHTDEKGVPRESRLTAWTRDMNEWANKAELIVDKRRRGPRGSAFVTFDPERSRFFNLAPDGMAKQADDFARRQGAHTTTRSSRANGPERPIRQDIDG